MFTKNSSEGPAFSNREIYELIYGEKPTRTKKNKAWRKAKRMFRNDESWTGSVTWNLIGLVSALLTAVALFSLLSGTLQETLVPLQLGAAAFLSLFIYSKISRENLSFSVAGVSAILLAVLLPALVLNSYSSLQTAALYLPAHLAVCGVAAVYRSDENLDVSYIVYKAFSYLVFTLLTGWLSLYALTNL